MSNKSRLVFTILSALPLLWIALFCFAVVRFLVGAFTGPDGAGALPELPIWMVSSVVAVPLTIILLVIGLAVLHRSALPSNAKMLWTILLIIFAPLALLPFAMRILPRLGSSPLGGQTESGRSA